MSNINKRLSELSPHVLGIRFTNNISVVDTYFKDGWTLPKSNLVGAEGIPNNDKNVYMLYPENENVGVDEMLDYVAYVIKVNVEREQKIELLQIKINELKQIFTKSSLDKCKTIKFTFSNLLETTSDTIDNYDLPIMSESEVDKNNLSEKTSEDLDADIPLVEIPKNDSEVERFNKTARVNNEVFDLPPKNGKIELQIFDEPKLVCKCDPNDPNQMCPECAEY